jgi:hypothetical protein
MNWDMTAATFRAALARLGLSHYQAAVLLGTQRQMIRKWASGRMLIPYPIAAQLIRRLASVPLFEMVVPAGCGATYFFVIAWPRADGVKLLEIGRSVGWLPSEAAEYMERRIAARDQRLPRSDPPPTKLLRPPPFTT